MDPDNTFFWSNLSIYQSSNLLTTEAWDAPFWPHLAILIGVSDNPNIKMCHHKTLEIKFFSVGPGLQFVDKSAKFVVYLP